MPIETFIFTRLASGRTFISIGGSPIHHHSIVVVGRNYAHIPSGRGGFPGKLKAFVAARSSKKPEKVFVQISEANSHSDRDIRR
jgi:hypothetical protein